MTSHCINLATLTWLDRRQLWATTNRASSLGASTVPIYPSMLGGQGSRPSVANRHFAPSLSWLISAAVVVFSLALAFVLVLLAARLILSLAFGRLTVGFDRALAANTENLRKPTLRATPIFGPNPLGFSTNFANLVYSLVGGLDAASPYTPACRAKAALTSPVCWEAGSLDLPLNGWGLGLAVRNPSSPSFRSYLGEWRRLVDQSSTSPTSCNYQGYVQNTRSRLAPSGFLAPTGGRSSGPSSNASPSTPNSANAYSSYLSTPWVF